LPGEKVSLIGKNRVNRNNNGIELTKLMFLLAHSVGEEKNGRRSGR
jgi:hypothetical protein